MAGYKVSDGAWIAPDGSIYNVSFCRHNQAALEILSAKGKNDIRESEAEKVLCSMGYLHIGLNYINSSYNNITDDQVSALFEILKSCDRSLDKAINTWLHS